MTKVQPITFLSAEMALPAAAASTADAQCRICNAAAPIRLGAVEYVAGYAWNVFNCPACGCTFTRHDDTVHELMHQTGAVSYYREYKAFAKQCEAHFSRGEIEGLERALSANSKYAFVIEQAARERDDARLLEIGCSRGYLTSYFILKGRIVLGVDVSSEAVADARSHYGEHFAIVGDPRIATGAPYDLVYHVGLIGCVGDPIGLTRQLLSMLKPGGRLVFNAPNRAGLALGGQLWLDTAPPPDVVTLFPRGFWTSQFEDVAVVAEREETLAPGRAFANGLRRVFGLRWRRPTPKDLKQSCAGGHAWSQDFGLAWRLVERILVKAARVSGIDCFAPSQPTDFGLFVTMQRK